MRRNLLTEFMMQAPYQPATNYWRAVEIEEVIKYGLPDGQGLDIDPCETALARERNIYREVVTAHADRLPFPNNHCASLVF